MSNLPQHNLHRLMARQGMTVEELAGRTGVDCRSIRGILDGRKRPQARTLHRLAKGLGVDADEFFLDPARLLYRRFDQQTNPEVAQAVARHPDLFRDWSEGDFEELHSRFGMGGALTFEGVLEAARRMNRNRTLHRKLALLLETGHAELVGRLIDAIYQTVVPGSLVPHDAQGTEGERGLGSLSGEHDAGPSQVLSRHGR